jgi:TRAP-type C4-dicarboxylate transport system permease small subunit
MRPHAALLVSVCIAFFLAVTLWGGVHLVILTRHQLSPAMRIPMAWPYLAIPISSLIMLLHELTFIHKRVNSMILSSGYGTEPVER